MKKEPVPCYLISTSSGQRVVVKGDLEKWAEEKKLKWKTLKNGERALYAGKYRCFVERISPESMLAMQYIFDNDQYSPYHV
jgi:hypothetical protein